MKGQWGDSFVGSRVIRMLLTMAAAFREDPRSSDLSSSDLVRQELRQVKDMNEVSAQV